METIEMPSEPAVASKIQSTPFKRAVDEGLIRENDGNHEQACRYVPITNWYLSGEEWMLENAIQQLGSKKHLVVRDKEKLRLYRACAEVIDVTPED